MNSVLTNGAILINRLEQWLEAMQDVHDNRREIYWSRFESVKGKVVSMTLAESKRRFKNQMIDRAQTVLDAINNCTAPSLDWIEYRDVLYHTGFEIDMLGFKSYKALRESNKEIMVGYKGSDTEFATTLKYHEQFI